MTTALSSRERTGSAPIASSQGTAVALWAASMPGAPRERPSRHRLAWDLARYGQLAAGAAVALAAVACGGGAPEPAPLDTRNEQCASCRMAVSNVRFASQLVAPGELPRFFDDLGCLADYLKAGKAPAGAAAFVADHRTRAWVRADRAIYTRVPGLETPMSSHLIAHADAASRDADPDARAGMPVVASELFGPAGPPLGGAR